MTTEEDARAHGWTRHENGIMTKPDGNTFRESLIGETGQLYVKCLGDDDVFRPYNADKD